MKRLFLISALTGILLQTFFSSMILTHYMMNKEFIAKNLCENRNKPMMHCNGKCHLRKQLEEQQKKDSAPLQSLKEKLELQYFSRVTLSIAAPALHELILPDTSYSFFIPKTAIRSVFHPPPAPVFFS